MVDQPLMIITGTSRGIGRALAMHYCRTSYKVIGFSRNDPDFTMPDYQHYNVDVADESGIKRVFSEIRHQYGKLNVLINNAGIASMNHSLLTPLETFKAIYRTNVQGPFILSREAAKLMKKQHFGRIVNFTSVAVPLKLAGESAYGSSKAAVIHLTQVLAKEFAEFGITVNAIGPNPMVTDLIKGVSEEQLSALLAEQCIRRYGEYRDIINVIDFYANPNSDFITGQVLFLGGIS